MKNIITLDQEKHGLAVVINGEETIDVTNPFDIVLPDGGGVVVADGNVWGVVNEKSVSQFVWDCLDTRQKFLDAAANQGYHCIAVSNKYAANQYYKRGYAQADAVRALYEEVAEQVDRHDRFDSGKPVRESRGDVSNGERATVALDFLRLQNAGGYESEFVQRAIEIAWNNLDTEGKKLFNLKIRSPKSDSPNRLCAVLVCTHDPETRERRIYNGKPWGKRFIIRNILCLNGTMMGTGALSPGTPMRAVLRILGRRHGDKVNEQERTALDRQVKKLVGIFQQHAEI